MMLFWVIAAVMIGIALAFVLPPLLQREPATIRDISERERREMNVAIYRDQLRELNNDVQNGIVSREQFEQDKEEIERRLLEDVGREQKIETAKHQGSRNTAYALALAVPLIAVVFYLKVGTADTASNRSTPVEPPSMGKGTRTEEQIQANVDKLAERLKSNPTDKAGWTMLARSYSSMERFGEATGAYAKATELNPNDADIWAEYGFATAMAGNRKIEGKALEFVNQALKVDPDNAKALQLAGTAAFDAKDYKKAIEIWQRVLKQVPPGSEVAQAITSRINEAKELANTR